jgi:protein gp37
VGETTKIEWCDATLNPWRGCSKVSPGCTHCYAEAGSKRNPKVLGVWGDGGTRVIASEAKWREPLKWDRDAARVGERRRVFCASLADVFEDRDELMAPRDRLWSLINRTPNLDWLLLTKRPEIARNYLDATLMGHEPPTNVWLGVSVEDQARADERIPILLQIPAAIKFLSAEPLLGPVDVRRYLGLYDDSGDLIPGVDWVIVGGESGHRARPMDLAWARSIRDQCQAAGVPYFFKQAGSRPFDSDAMRAVPGHDRRMTTVEEATSDESLAVLGACLDAGAVRLRDPKGGELSELPPDLQIREFPDPVRADRCASP